MQQKKKLIIFGGSFDPIHKGHLKIALRAFKKIKADKLFFVPCNNHPHDKKISASNQDRINMLKLGIKGYPRFEICDFEMKRNQTSYTIDTVNYFKEYYSDYKLYLLIGYDQLLKFKSWHKYEEIIEHAKIICHKRPLISSPTNKNKVENIDELNSHENLAKDLFLDSKQDKDKLVDHISIGAFSLMNISSNQIRIKPKKSHLSIDVLNYINENGIYATNRLKEKLSDYRYEHSCRVADIAVDIAKSLKYYPLLKKAYVAGIYHDYAKEEPKEFQTNWFTLFKIGYLFKYKKQAKQELIEKGNNSSFWKVIHAWLGAYQIKKEFYINDYQVLNAIRNHTIMETENNVLAKIVYCADKLDIRKDGEIEDRKRLYELCKKDLDKGYNEIVNKLKEKGINN